MSVSRLFLALALAMATAVFGISIAAPQLAHSAVTATIASNTTIAVGATGQINVVITSSTNDFNFAVSPNNAAEWTIDFGTTNLRFAGGGSRNSARQVTIPLQPNPGGSAQLGTILITANAAAFDPPLSGGDTSNTISVAVTAPPPVIEIPLSAAPLASGTVNPSVTVQTTNATFESTLTDDSFTVSPGVATNLALASATYVSATQATLSFTGTAGNGGISITADATAFTPSAGSPSNTLTVGISPVIATASTVSAGAVNPIVVITTSTSSFTSSPSVSDVVVFGNAGLTSASNLVRDSSAQLTVTLNGTATAGTLEIAIEATAFDDPGTSSNSLAITVSGAPGPGPTPTPPTPPSAPTDATSTAGNASVTVSWSPPAAPGSFPVTYSQVQSTPSSSGCLVPVSATSCTIAGLANGTRYTFQVRALNGGGWGAWADAGSAMPTPSPDPGATIVITGSRAGNDREVRIAGVTTGLAGATVQAWVKLAGATDFAAGSLRIVDSQGTFNWQRRTGRSLEVYFVSSGVESNTVRIRSRG